MNMTPKAVDFVNRYNLTDVRQCGDALLLSPADYWKLANQVSDRFVREKQSEPAKGFLADVDEFHIYLDQEVAGTGRTASSDPSADFARLQQRYEASRKVSA